MDYDALYMGLALDKAWEYQLLTYPNPAVGATVVHNGRIVAVEAHQKAGSSHAEVRALLVAYEQTSGMDIDFDHNDAQKAHKFLLSLPDRFFKSCSIYVTLEPCSHHGKTPSCATLLSKLKLQEIVIGIADPISGHDGGANLLKQARFGVLEQRCRELIEPFMIWQKRAFVLFKIAQTVNGRIGGGYLSSQESLIHVHKLRAVCSQMLIGGNTVRIDRPTLDCRFIDAPAPNITIYSRGDDFDREIPLFTVPDRVVKVTDDLSFLDTPSLILVEGGEGMLREILPYMDMLLVYQTPNISTNSLRYSVASRLDIHHSTMQGKDLSIWYSILK